MKKLIWLFTLISGLVLLPLMSTAPLRAQTNDLAANKALLTAFFEAEAARAYDRLDKLFVKDFVRHSVATTAIMPEVKVTSLDDYKQFLKATAAMFPDYYNTPQMLVAEGNYVAAYSIWSGTYVENGNRIKIPIVGFARCENGKIAEMWWEWDNLTWNTQMGKSTLEPGEVPISSINDVVGVWIIKGLGYEWRLQLLPDGTANVGSKESPTIEDSENFAIEGNQIHWLSSSKTYVKEAHYAVFVKKENGKPVSLRFILLGDDNYPGRKDGLAGKVLRPAVP